MVRSSSYARNVSSKRASRLRPGHNPVVCAYGASETKEALDYVIAKTGDALYLGRHTTLSRDARRRVPWSRFVSVLPQIPLKVEPEPYLTVPAGPRTVKTMLTYIADLGNLLDETSASAIALLGGEDKIQYGMEIVPPVCNHLGKLCRNSEIEGIFWPDHFWREAVEGHEIFMESSVPPHYIPDAPQLWYFEQPFAITYVPKIDEPVLLWLTAAWRVSSVALMPVRGNDKEGCNAVFLFEHTDPNPDDPDEMLPRVAVVFLLAKEACRSGVWTICMAGFEFMNEVVPRTPAEYSSGAKREAHRTGTKLQPYSIMELRHTQAPPDTAQVGGDTDQKHTYHFSFFQRRHRRQLKEPRKSDGVQVIRVAAYQKCKHLPLKPSAEIKVTKVVR